MNTDQFDALSATVKDALGPDLISITFANNEATAHVYSASVVRVLTILSDYAACQFTQLIDITACDYPDRVQRFDVVYHLLSVVKNMRIRVKTQVADGTHMPSVIQVYSAANWYEREVWDLFGIAFTDHPDLRRIMTDYNFSGHPLRKDFPVSGYTQVRYCAQEGRVLSEPVQFQQEYRTFDFLSPWEGIVKESEIVKG